MGPSKAMRLLVGNRNLLLLMLGRLVSDFGSSLFFCFNHLGSCSQLRWNAGSEPCVGSGVGWFAGNKISYLRTEDCDRNFIS